MFKSVSDAVTNQIINITQSQLISPWTSYAVGKATNKISTKIQNKLIKRNL